MTLEQYLHEKVSHKKRINETKFVHNDKRYSTQKVDVVLIFINNKIQRSKLTSENLILLLKFALCILVFCIKAHSKNSDNTNIDTEKPSCTTSSTISKPRNHQVFLEILLKAPNEPAYLLLLTYRLFFDKSLDHLTKT